ncbi:uncharacterized protein LOC110037215 isoform X2 [Phalaenopsis equestris]|uniref:uncharacterized protein LOC110037215 isoform X2 n=1 Tax=Phalaenopsis equestris TaxID=78828 RepID=UPI0009E632A1|nr:uncharacterized protein LOC110037215 isoform X2 [Phalaenopsis equestris]
MLKRKQRAACDATENASTLLSLKNNIVTYAHLVKCNLATHVLVSISTTRTPEWIIDFAASRHVTGNAGEFPTSTRLAVPESIQTAVGTTQLMVDKGDLSIKGNWPETWDRHVT